LTGEFFDFNFHVPRFPNKGRFAQISVYAEDGSRDASVTKKDIELAYPDSSSTKPKDGPPRIELGFKGGLDIIKPGAILEGFIRDPDGINILKTNNEGKHVLIIDQSNFGRDVTDYFTFGPPGGADTTGILSYPLDEISVGSHSAVYKVSDSFGQIAFDTLTFTVIDPMQHYAEAVFNYPNPFEDSTHFLFHLSEQASIKLDVFTSSGKKIRSLDGMMDAGEAWLYWDGRDYLGEKIANGVYLFAATISFMQSDSPSKIIRGKLVKIE